MMEADFAKQKNIYISQEKNSELKSELDYLTKILKPKLIERIRLAKELGGVNENADLEGAVVDQDVTNARIFYLESILKKSKILSKTSTTKIVTIGSTVVVEIEDKSYRYVVVSSPEADPGNGKISDESPLGSAICGCSINDIVQVKTPTGSYFCRIVDIA